MAGRGVRNVDLRIGATNKASKPLGEIRKALRALEATSDDFAKDAPRLSTALGTQSTEFKKLEATMKGGLDQAVRRVAASITEMTSKLGAERAALSQTEATLSSYQGRLTRLEAVKKKFGDAAREAARQSAASGKAIPQEEIDRARARYQKLTSTIDNYKTSIAGMSGRGGEIAITRKNISGFEAGLKSAKATLSEINGIAGDTARQLDRLKTGGRLRPLLDEAKRLKQAMKDAGAPSPALQNAYKDAITRTRIEATKLRDAQRASGAAARDAGNEARLAAARAQGSGAARIELERQYVARLQASRQAIRDGVRSIREMERALARNPRQADAINDRIRALRNSMSLARNEARNLTASIRQTRSATGDIQTGRNSGFTALGNNARSAGTAVQGLRGHIVALVASFAGIAGMVQESGRIVTAFRNIEAAQSRLRYVFDGNDQRTGREFRYLAAQADKFGFSLMSLTQDYTKFAAAAKGAGVTIADTRTLFEGVSAASRVNKLNSTAVSRVFVALQQMLSKNGPQMEELRGQLSESLPGAVALFARAMGYGQDQMLDFYKAVEERKFDASDVVEFGRFMGEEFNPYVEAAAEGFEAKLGRMQTALFMFRARIAKGGFIDTLKVAMDEITEGLQGTETAEIGEKLSVMLGGFAEVVPNLVDAVLRLAGGFASFGVAMSGPLRVGSEILAKVAHLIPALVAVKFAGWASAVSASLLKMSTGGMAAMRTAVGLRAGLRLMGAGAVQAAAQTSLVTGSMARLQVATAALTSRFPALTGTVNLASASMSRLGVVMTAVGGRAATIAAVGLARVAMGVRALFVAAGGPIGVAALAAIYAFSRGASRAAEASAELRGAQESSLKVVEKIKDGYADAKGDVDAYRKSLEALTEVEARKAQADAVRSRSLTITSAQKELDALYSDAITGNQIKDAGSALQRGIIKALDTIDIDNSVFDLSRILVRTDGNSQVVFDDYIRRMVRTMQASLAGEISGTEALNLIDKIVGDSDDTRIVEFAARMQKMLREVAEADDKIEVTGAHLQVLTGSAEEAAAAMDTIGGAAKDILDPVEKARDAKNKFREALENATASSDILKSALDYNSTMRALQSAVNIGINALKALGAASILSAGQTANAIGMLQRLMAVEANSMAASIANAQAGLYGMETGLEASALEVIGQRSGGVVEVGADGMTLVVSPERGHVDRLTAAIEDGSAAIAAGEAEAGMAAQVEAWKKEIRELRQISLIDEGTAATLQNLNQFGSGVSKESLGVLQGVALSNEKFAAAINDPENTTLKMAIKDGDFETVRATLKEYGETAAEELFIQYEGDVQLKKANAGAVKAAEEAAKEAEKRLEKISEFDIEIKANLDDESFEASIKGLSEGEQEYRRTMRDYELKAASEGIALEGERLAIAKEHALAVKSRIDEEEAAKDLKQAEKDRAKAAKDAAKASKDAAKAAEEELQHRRGILDAYRQLEEGRLERAQESGDVVAADQAIAKLEELDQAYRKTLVSEQEFWKSKGGLEAEAKVLQIQEEIEALDALERKRTQLTRTEEHAVAAAGKMTDAFRSMFESMREGMSAFDALGNAVRRMVSDMLIQLGMAIAKAAIFMGIMTALGMPMGFGGALAATTGGSGGVGQMLTSAALQHDGGITGSVHRSRQVPVGLFDNAMRYHGGGIAGLAPNEVPAILETGEEVLTRDNPRHRKNAGNGGSGEGQNPNIKIINSLDGAEVLEAALQSVAGEKIMMNFMARAKREME